MGRDVLFDARRLLIVLDDLPKALTAHALTVHVDEQGRLRLVGDDPGPDVPYVVLKGLHRTVVQGDDALLAPAAAPDEARCQVHIRHVQADELRYPYAGGVQQLQHGMIPEALLVHAAGLLQKQLHLFVGQYLRVLPLCPVGHHRLGGVGLHDPGGLHIPIKGFQRGGAACHGGRGLPPPLQIPQVLVDGIGLDPPQIGCPVFQQPTAELVQIPQIGADGVGGGVLLLLQIAAVCRNMIRQGPQLLS